MSVCACSCGHQNFWWCFADLSSLDPSVMEGLNKLLAVSLHSMALVQFNGFQHLTVMLQRMLHFQRSRPWQRE
mgnify:CR=1 FL=1